ncbi:MAG: V-type ATP synthase subunit D [Defluviitaleaceae bacterium]|nr:V-type ATP synthase subunit D [Defluviitaleaceae bacterium]
MKTELMRLKQELKMAQRGYDLLELKRQALQITLRAVKKRIDVIRAEAAAAVNRAYDALEAAHQDIGINNVEKIRRGCLADKGRMTHLPLAGTTVSLDEATITWQAAVKNLIAYIDAENEWLVLQQDLRKTSKRASALQNIRIPRSQARIKYIESKLDEREHETIARLKRITASRL